MRARLGLVLGLGNHTGADWEIEDHYVSRGRSWGEPATVETIDGYHIAIRKNPIHVTNVEKVWE